MLSTKINLKDFLGLGKNFRALADGGVLGPTHIFYLDFPPIPWLGSVRMDFYGLNQLCVMLLGNIWAKSVADLIQLISDGKDLSSTFTFLQLLNHGPQLLRVCDILSHSERASLIISLIIFRSALFLR